MKTQKFGIEIELTGITRAKAAKIMAKKFGTTEEHEGGGYDTYTATDRHGRKWKVMSDGSIKTVNGRGNSAGREYSCEIVSPICQYEDIETIQEIVRLLRRAGAVANASCGIHVHIDAAPHTPQSLRNISNIMVAKEDMLFKALEVSANRAARWCKKADMQFIEQINNRKPQTREEMLRLWYNGGNRSGTHYDSSRYHALNLHSVWQKGTIEFRCFNGTTHAGKIKTYIQLCLAISHQALTQRTASARKTRSTNEKFTFRTWLLHMGLIGDEFETARYHLLNALTGNSAFRYRNTNEGAAAR